MIEVTPTKFELYDTETKDHVANVEMFDEGAAHVEIKTVVDAQSWADVSAAIQVALSHMFATGRGIVRTTVEIEDTASDKEPNCSRHPDAPHGFNRNASHSLNRYVCDCEGWKV